jgi:hypothetical protein
MSDFGNIIVKVLNSQATQNLRWHQESQMVLLEKNLIHQHCSGGYRYNKRGPPNGLKTQDLGRVLWVQRQCSLVLPVVTIS